MSARALWMLVLGLALSGCATVRYESPSLSGYPIGERYRVRYVTYLWGMVGGRPLSLDQCGEPGIAKMKVKPNWVDDIVIICTLGIVVPVRVVIICAEQK